MRPRIAGLVAGTLLGVWSSPGAAMDWARAPQPWDGLGRNLSNAFLGPEILFQFGGIGITALMSTQGVDADIQEFFADHERLGSLGVPGLVAGFIVPVVAIGGFYLAGWQGNDVLLIGAGAALLQACVFGIGYVSLLKLITGRAEPPDEDSNLTSAEVDARSREWNFGFNRAGLWDGWPSGHTAAAVTVGVTLASYFNEQWVSIVGYAFVGYMMFSVTAGEQGSFHWASDAVAAALMTWPIANATGRGFRRLVDGEPPDQRVSVVPMMSGDRIMLVAQGVF